jgi:hypothetical protein
VNKVEHWDMCNDQKRHLKKNEEIIFNCFEKILYPFLLDTDQFLNVLVIS